MKLKVEVDMEEFWSEIDSWGDWLRRELKDELLKETIKAAKKDNRWKNLIELQVAKLFTEG